MKSAYGKMQFHSDGRNYIVSVDSAQVEIEVSEETCRMPLSLQDWRRLCAFVDSIIIKETETT